MSQRQSLSISLQSLAVGPGTDYWLNMEQMQEMTDAVTFEQAAEFIDALYDIDPCVPIEGEAGGEAAEEDGEGNPVAPVEEEEFVSLAQQMLERAALCGTLDGSYECKIRVARSHQNEPYKLVIDNGEELQRVTEQGRASQTLIVKGEASASLKLPVLGNLAYEWQGPVYDLSGVCPGPAVELLGSTLNFGKRVTGTVTAHFDTQYDLVTCKIDGNSDGEPQPARVLAFYAGLVAEQQIEPPEISEEDEDARRTLCDQAGAGLNPTPDRVSCYEAVDYVTRCRCSRNIIDEKTTSGEHGMPCPDGLDCPGGVSECRKLIRSRQVTVGYASCPDEEHLEGTVSDPEYYEEMCCEPPQWPLPPCKTVTGIFQGGKGISDEDRAAYPGAMFVGVGPDDGICGEKVTTWQVASKDCCDDVTPLEWDEEHCGLVAPCWMHVIGGKPPYIIRVTGAGFSLHPTVMVNEIEDSDGWFMVYLLDGNCGAGQVLVTDQCNQHLDRTVRSPNGHWADEGDPLSYWVPNIAASVSGVLAHFARGSCGWGEIGSALACSGPWDSCNIGDPGPNGDCYEYYSLGLYRATSYIPAKLVENGEYRIDRDSCKGHRNCYNSVVGACIPDGGGGWPSDPCTIIDPVSGLEFDITVYEHCFWGSHVKTDYCSNNGLQDDIIQFPYLIYNRRYHWVCP